MLNRVRDVLRLPTQRTKILVVKTFGSDAGLSQDVTLSMSVSEQGEEMR